MSEIITVVLQLVSGPAAVILGVHILRHLEEQLAYFQRLARERGGKIQQWWLGLGKPTDLIYPGVGAIGIGIYVTILGCVNLVKLLAG